MKNTTQMRERLAEARAVLRGDAVAAVPVMVVPVNVVQVSTSNSHIPVGTRYQLERWKDHDRF